MYVCMYAYMHTYIYIYIDLIVYIYTNQHQPFHFYGTSDARTGQRDMPEKGLQNSSSSGLVHRAQIELWAWQF